MKILADLRAIVRGMAIIEEARKNQRQPNSGIDCDFSHDQATEIIKKEPEPNPIPPTHRERYPDYVALENRWMRSEQHYVNAGLEAIRKYTKQ